MAIELNSLCIACLTGKHAVRAHSLGDSQTGLAFTRELIDLCYDPDIPQKNSALLSYYIDKLYEKYYGLGIDRYKEEKAQSNRFVLDRLPMLEKSIASAPDPLERAVQYAILGNYLDFSALGKQVSFEKLEQMLRDPSGFSVEKDTFAGFRRDLQRAKKLLLITDNAGEIVFDGLLARQIQKEFPEVEITFCVRGGPVHNDATREDAALCVSDFPVIDSGCPVGGTHIPFLGEEAKNALYGADLILAKGMGNTESLYGCGLPVYYAFLVKCARLQEFFQKPMMTSMLVKEGQQ